MASPSRNLFVCRESQDTKKQRGERSEPVLVAITDVERHNSINKCQQAKLESAHKINNSHAGNDAQMLSLLSI